jgi:hypothetical protein
MERIEMEAALVCFKAFPVGTEEIHENIRIAGRKPGLEPCSSRMRVRLSTTSSHPLTFEVVCWK